MATKQKRRVKKKKINKFPRFMKSKLVLFFAVILACLCALIGRIMYINYNDGAEYKKKVLAKQNYDSKDLPCKRGDILDAKGTPLATSTAIYNVILDCTVLCAKEKYIEPTVSALMKCFPTLQESEIRGYIAEPTKRPYIVLMKGLAYDEIQDFVNLQDAVNEKNEKLNPDIKGVWFEKEYKRSYPYNSLAADVIGFTSGGTMGLAGLELYYDDELSGVNGREYGYLNSDSDFEKTVISPQDGNSICISIDENIQSIVETKISEFAEAYRDNERKGEAGAQNIALVIQNPNTGEILAMASYPTFDLMAPRDMTAFFTEEEIAALSEDEVNEFLNNLWQNYCVSHTYEPGSVQKPFTVAAGIETGTVSKDLTFKCDGYEMFGGSKVTCVNKKGHGAETVKGALMDSCNDSLMQMSYLIGKEKFLEYQSVFGFGQRTSIDLPGEPYTAGLLYTEETMKPIDLATNSFGQNYNCTMVQMISAYSSLVNGGTYYQPHLLNKIVDANGNTVSTVQPIAVKKTISKSTSDLLRSYMYDTVSSGTGKYAKVDGYSMGGKTGTAQKLPRDAGNYLVSFMGYVPNENPQLVIYCIVDTPNASSDNQAHSYYAQDIIREVLKEVLPYMNIFPDEELTGVNSKRTIRGVKSETQESEESESQEPETVDTPDEVPQEEQDNDNNTGN